jgi:hypothetical protein
VSAGARVPQFEYPGGHGLSARTTSTRARTAPAVAAAKKKAGIFFRAIRTEKDPCLGSLNVLMTKQKPCWEFLFVFRAPKIAGYYARLSRGDKGRGEGEGMRAIKDVIVGREMP